METKKVIDESKRLAALDRYAVLDTPAEKDFDDFTHLASLICQTPIALISLVDEQRQWFKSQVGLEVRETPRNISFCQHAIEFKGVFEIGHALQDERFRENPLVKGEPHIRFYAGAPLVTPDGHTLGTLCVIDRTPRQLTTQQRDGLTRLARKVISLLELRRSRHELQQELAARKEAEVQLARNTEALRQSNERTEQIIASALDAVVTMDLDGLVTSWNPQAVIIFGWSVEEVLGRRMSEVIIPPAYREAHELGHQHLIKTGEAKVLNRRMELTALRRDGTEFPIELTIAKVMAGGRQQFSAFIRDLTEQKKIAARLAEAEQEEARLERQRLEDLEEYSTTLERRVHERTAEVERVRRQFQDLFELAPDALVMTDQEGKIQMVNRQAERMFGWPRAELVGQYEESLIPHARRAGHATERGRFLETARARSMGASKSNLLGLRKDGTEFPVEISLSPVQTEDDTLVTAAVRDISERKQLEQELARISSHEQERLAHELHDHLGAYLAGIAFRVKTLAENLERHALAEATTARELVLQVNAGIDQVRNFARLLAPADLATGGLAAGLTQLALEMETVFGISCRVELPREPPPLTQEQSMELYRIAQEATRNAVQHGKARQVTISVQCDADCLIQRVSNDGQPWNSELESVQGLGLRIMRHRASSLGGTLVIQAAPSGRMEAICKVPITPDNASAAYQTSHL